MNQGSKLGMEYPSSITATNSLLSLDPVALREIDPTNECMSVDADDVAEVFRCKHKAPSQMGWIPRMDVRFGYFNPDDYYEAALSKLVRPETRWLDVGCGRTPFPSNPKLAGVLSQRCKTPIGVDPSATINDNTFVDTKVMLPIEEFSSADRFDLITMRTTAEHVEAPAAVAATLARLTNPGGCVVIYTVHRWSPIPVLTRFLLFSIHHRLKSLVWKVRDTDSFPTVYRMNTRKALARTMNKAGFAERCFVWLDDCRTSGRFRMLRHLELSAWTWLRKLGIRYPEGCLLAIYRRRQQSAE